jgi:hypothetical protein
MRAMQATAPRPRTCGVPQDRYAFARGIAPESDHAGHRTGLFFSKAEAGHKPRPWVNPVWSLTPRSTPTRSGRQRKAGVRHSVLCSHTSLTPPAYAGGVTSNVRLHKKQPLQHHCQARPWAAQSKASSLVALAVAPGSGLGSARAAMPNPTRQVLAHSRRTDMRHGLVLPAHWLTSPPLVLVVGAPGLTAARLWRLVHSACALCKTSASWPRTCRVPQERYSSAHLCRSGTPARTWCPALSSFTGPSSQRGPKPSVNPRWSLTPRSTPTRSGRRCKPGLRYFVLCSQPRLTAPTSAGGVTSNVRPHTNSPCAPPPQAGPNTLRQRQAKAAAGSSGTGCGREQLSQRVGAGLSA